MRPRLLRSLLVLCAAAPAVASGQGSLGMQGFGYPPGQLGVRASGTGGALGEFDPTSALNPAAIASWERTAFTMSYQPEIRTVDAGSKSDRTVTSRFPVFSVGSRITPRLALAVHLSTLLDRTWMTQSHTTVTTSSGDVGSLETFRSAGAINDIRLGAGYSFGDRVRIGLGGHALTGENRLTVGRDFDDTLAFASLLTNSTISYGGMAVSGGVELRPSKALAVAGSARLGGRLRAYSGGDTVIASGRAPSRAGASLRYTGFSGVTVALRSDWTGWSKMNELATGSAHAEDTWDNGLGVEAGGPKFGARVVQLRAGVRARTLPFLAAGERVKEKSLAFGAGLPFARERAMVDLSAQRASRSAGGGVTEHAWLLGFSLTVHPQL